MTMPTALAGLVAVLLLAGCLQPDGGPDRIDGDAPQLPTFRDGTAAPTTFTLGECYEHGGSFPAPAEAYADRLPDGFSVAPYTALGTLEPEPTSTTGELFAIASRCDGGDLHRAMVVLFVDPPEAWRNPEAAFGHMLVLSYTTASQQHAEVLEAWGMGPGTTGDVSLDLTETPAGRTADTAASGGGWTLAIETVVLGPPTEMASNQARFFVAENGTVTGAADAAFGALQAILGEARLSGSGDAGPWQQVPTEPGVGLHGWGHDNVWSHVDLPARA